MQFDESSGIISIGQLNALKELRFAANTSLNAQRIAAGTGNNDYINGSIAGN